MNILQVKSDVFNPFDYWSDTYDVLVIRGEEDDARLVIVARCETRADAEAVARSDDRGRDYFAFIRPPNRVVTEAIEWLNASMRSAKGLRVERD